MEDKKLQSLIEMATDDQLSERNLSVNTQIADLIATRAHLPKVALALIRKRLLVNNSQVIALSIDLLSDITQTADLPFFTQVCSKEFLQQVQSILLFKKNDSLVQPRLIALIQLWVQHLHDKKDILPSFFHFHETLLKKGIVQPIKIEQVRHSPKKIKKDGKYGKLGQDLELVQGNICLINDMLNNIKPGESLTHNDTIRDMVKRILESQKKLQELITNNEISDEKIMQFCLDLNDDCMNVLRKYKDIKSGKKYYYKEIQASQPQVQLTKPSIQMKATNNNDLLDIDLLGDEPSQPQPQVQKATNSNFDDIFNQDNGSQIAQSGAQTNNQPALNTLNQLYSQSNNQIDNGTNQNNQRYDVFNQPKPKPQPQNMNPFNQMQSQMNFNQSQQPNQQIQPNQPFNQSMFNMANPTQNQFSFNMPQNNIQQQSQQQSQPQVNDPFDKIDQKTVLQQPVQQNFQQQQFVQQFIGNDDDLI